MSVITKNSLTDGAFALLRISGITRNPTPSEKMDALAIADDYAAELKAEGLDVGWQYPAEYGNSDSSDISGLTIEMAGPFKKLLAPELAPLFGKEVTPVLAKISNDGMNRLEQLLVSVPNAQNPPTLPFGSGNEQGYRDRTYYDEPANNKGADYVFKTNILNYTQDFTSWLGDETLSAVTWEAEGDGITIGTKTNDDYTATAELTFDKIGGWTVCATATKTNSTDVFTIRKNFVVRDCDQPHNAIGGF